MRGEVTIRQYGISIAQNTITTGFQCTVVLFLGVDYTILH